MALRISGNKDDARKGDRLVVVFDGNLPRSMSEATNRLVRTLAKPQGQNLSEPPGRSHTSSD
jgi:hypothetical protein